MTSRTHPSAPRLWATIAIALMLAVLSTVPAMADPPPPDHFHPPVVNETLLPGESIDVQKELHLSGLPAKADIIVAIDTTGSMGGALAAAQADATQICSDVQAAIPGARFAAVEFEDYPISPYGGPGDVPYLLHTPGYVSDCATFSAAVNSMILGFGGDGPESYNRVNFEAYSDPVILASRDPQATQFLVVLGDNVPHSVASFGACPSTAPFSDPGRNGMNEMGGGDDLETPATVAGLSANDITLLMIDYGGFALACHDAMANATGGDAVPAAEADDIAVFIIDSAESVEYTVDLEVSAGCQLGISFNPAPPYGPFSGPQNIPFTETITAPATPGDYTCTVTAVMNPGGPTAVEVINVTVLQLFEGRMTGGGNLKNAEGTRVTLGLTLQCDATETPNNLQVNWGKNRFHLEKMAAAMCLDDPTLEPAPPTAAFDTHRGSGAGRYNGESGATAEWRLTDGGERGSNDTVELTITNAGGDVVLVVSGNLEGGNLQAHDD